MKHPEEKERRKRVFVMTFLTMVYCASESLQNLVQEINPVAKLSFIQKTDAPNRLYCMH